MIYSTSRGHMRCPGFDPASDADHVQIGRPGMVVREWFAPGHIQQPRDRLRPRRPERVRDRALALSGLVVMLGQVVATPAASESPLVLRCAVDEFGADDSVDGEVAELFQARDEQVESRECTLAIVGHGISVPAAKGVDHLGLAPGWSHPSCRVT